MLELLLLLLPVAAACGWYAGFRHRDSREPEKDGIISRDYYLVGLNYLINEQPDKAVDVFIKMLEVNSDTVETHLALGSLFRRRGEVDRAIRIHQNLIARPQLTTEQRQHALAELGEDYLRAGVLDRAERVFLELIALGGETAANFNRLLHIYQQQKDWKQAVTIADKIQVDDNLHTPIAYYYCELADQARVNGGLTEAHEHLKQAIMRDKHCVRAHILLGKLYLEAGDYKNAIHAYKTVIEEDPDYLSEVLVFLAESYKQLQQEEDFVQYLNQCLAAFPQTSILLALSDYIREKQGDAAALLFITEHIQSCLSLRGIAYLLDIYLKAADQETKDKLFLLQQFIEKLLKNKPTYRCVHCGFSGKQLYWQCPSCKRWGGVKPIQGVKNSE